MRRIQACCCTPAGKPLIATFGPMSALGFAAAQADPVRQTAAAADASRVRDDGARELLPEDLGVPGATGEISHLGMPQYEKTDGKTLWSVSAWHSNCGRQGQPWGLGTASSAVLLL